MRGKNKTRRLKLKSSKLRSLKRSKLRSLKRPKLRKRRKTKKRGGATLPTIPEGVEDANPSGVERRPQARPGRKPSKKEADPSIGAPPLTGNYYRI